MLDSVHTIGLFERFGRQVVDLLWLPSLEALLLGVLVWVLLFVNPGCPARIRHFLWLLVLAKPLLTLVLPWHGPFEIPWASMASHGVPAAGGHNALASGVYAVAGLVWMGFAGFGLYRIGSSVVTMTRRRRRSVPVAVPRVSALFDRCLAESGLKRKVALRVSDEFEVPVLIAAGRPAVVIPSWCILELSSAELRQVLLHELAHYARRDHLTVFLVQFSRFFFFFHPAVWYAAYRAGIEAERACDADVVRVSRQPERYASTLLKVATGQARTHWQAALELARSASMAAQRIRDVLGSTVNRKDRAFFPLLAAGICSLIAVMPLLRPAVEAPGDAPVPPRTSMSGEPAIPVRIDNAPSTPNHEGPGPETQLAVMADAPLPPGRPANRRTMVDGRPAPRRPMAVMMQKPVVLPGDGILESTERERINPAVLGQAAPVNPDRTLSTGNQARQGRIEVQGVGRTGNELFDPGTVSLSAGYFITPTHQFGGVFSIRRPNDTEAFDDTRRPSAAPYGGSLLRARKLARIGTSSAQARVIEASEEEQAERITRIGAFYRYNLLVPGDSFTPFFGWGAGLEIRPQNRNMTMIDAGVGLRYFWERHVAVVVQASYRKELDVVSRPYPEMTLGFSAIF
ncbi:MAG: M48 family metalloprotease [Gemmatimonadetes bacterium]|nr:M48 family metalloprotease [Gemmatimonadota bacterium]MYH17762.1 M48 family metalloprotease [Gemmatimonadota bacterium]MYK98964.1 M48 family metalloprotease [Gemmatimonadota bacterium]